MKTKHYRTVAAASACAGLALLKMAFPGVSQELRDKLHGACDGEPAYIEAFRELGSRLSVRNMKEAEKEPEKSAEMAKPQTAGPAYLSYYLEEGTTKGEFAETDAEPELPRAVTAFLERQSAFSDYALPENADYSYVPLPFDYCSPVAGYSSSGFGYREHPILNTVRFHFGTDFAANSGENVVAFADGTVCFAGSDDSFGRHLKIDHGNGWVSHYCHCSRLLVSEGQKVSRGELVALVGATGLATGPHLHFELSRDGVFLNPEYYLNV